MLPDCRKSDDADNPTAGTAAARPLLPVCGIEASGAAHDAMSGAPTGVEIQGAIPIVF